MDDSIDYGMQYEEDAQDGSQDSEHQSQTQSTQEASQQAEPVSLDAHLWGYLQPCSAALTRIDFWKIHPRYTMGRNKESNQVVLPGPKISK